MEELNAILAPGMFVRHPDHADWGLGQIQSSVANKITINFQEVGKVVIDGTRVTLIPVFDA